MKKIILLLLLPLLFSLNGCLEGQDGLFGSDGKTGVEVSPEIECTTHTDCAENPHARFCSPDQKCVDTLQCQENSECPDHYHCHQASTCEPLLGASCSNKTVEEQCKGDFACQLHPTKPYDICTTQNQIFCENSLKAFFYQEQNVCLKPCRDNNFCQNEAFTSEWTCNETTGGCEESTQKCDDEFEFKTTNDGCVYLPGYYGFNPDDEIDQACQAHNDLDVIKKGNLYICVGKFSETLCEFHSGHLYDGYCFPNCNIHEDETTPIDDCHYWQGPEFTCNETTGVCENLESCTLKDDTRCTPEGVVQYCDGSLWQNADHTYCTGGSLTTCSGDQKYSRSCNSGCDATQDRCNEDQCVAGEERCEENTLENCIEGKWTLNLDCNVEGKFCAYNEKQPADCYECAPDTYQCGGDETDEWIDHCVDGLFLKLKDCDSKEQCIPGGDAATLPVCQSQNSCDTNAACGPEQYCDIENQICKTDLCKVNSITCGQNMICDQESGSCDYKEGYCGIDSDCGPDQQCVKDQGICLESCTSASVGAVLPYGPYYFVCNNGGANVFYWSTKTPVCSDGTLATDDGNSGYTCNDSQFNKSCNNNNCHPQLSCMADSEGSQFCSTDDSVICDYLNGELVDNGAGGTICIPRPEIKMWEAITAGTYHTCGILNGALYCWGDNGNGQLGVGEGISNAITPMQVGTDRDWITISAGSLHTCGIRDEDGNNNLYCWGEGGRGRIGDNGTSVRKTPVKIGSNFLVVSAGENHTCSIDMDKTAYCWGNHTVGRLGLGEDVVTDQLIPVKIKSDEQWEIISAGVSHTCGITEKKETYCWGKGNDSAIGNGTNTTAYTPALIFSPVSGQDWSYLLAGSYHNCAIDNNDTLYCWGGNSYGQVGNDQAQNQNTPQTVIIDQPHNWQTFSTGGFHTCGLNRENDLNKLYCWGRNDHGQIGNGVANTTNHYKPLEITTNFEWQLITTGSLHTCGISQEEPNQLYCWGNNEHSQLGFDSNITASVPTLVTKPE